MPDDPVVDDCQAQTAESRPEEATAERIEKRTEKFEIDAVTQEQEGGATTSEPEP